MSRVLRPFPWALLGHLCLGIVLAPVLALVLAAALLAVPLAVLSPAIFLGLVKVFAVLVEFDRARFHVLQGLDVGRPIGLPTAERSGTDRLAVVLDDPQFRRAAGYVVVRVALALFEVTVLTLVLTRALIVVVALVAQAVLTGYDPPVLAPLWEPLRVVIGAAVMAVVLLFVVPWVVRGLAWVDAWVTGRLLGVEPDELQRRVGELVEARARTVSAADAERARLERNLHDGAQQRLIALSVLLGQAEARLSDAAASGSDDDGTLALVRRARAETSGTIDELRTLTRGLRPPILEARGLDAALSAVASRLPMPVELDIRLGERPDPALEAMLYFGVAEALTNVAKHGAGAGASVLVERADDVLRARVSDAGPGGADVALGTGLRGIADRLSGVDGHLYLSSPVGGPTILTMEVPCG